MQLTNIEFLTAQFYAWELRGRGWYVHDTPVHLEPPYMPFERYFLPETHEVIDDGRKHTIYTGVKQGIKNLLKKRDTSKENLERDVALYLDAISTIEPKVAPEVQASDVFELVIAFPEMASFPVSSIKEFFLSLKYLAFPLSIEFHAYGTNREMICAVHANDKDRVVAQMQVHFPGIIIREERGLLLNRIHKEPLPSIIDFGLADEFMLPLKTQHDRDRDSLLGVLGTLNMIQQGEFGAVQVLFQQAHNNWHKDIAKSVFDDYGNPFFLDAPEISQLTQEKITAPLFAVSLRVIGQAATDSRSDTIARHLAQSLNTFERHGSNSFIPLEQSEYPQLHQVRDVVLRQSHRLGMLLNSDELATLAHIPQGEVAYKMLFGGAKKTKAAPPSESQATYLLGQNIHGGIVQDVRLDNQSRLRHIHVIGATGTGKSNLLINLVTQDINAGIGCAVLDPHGDLIDRILERIPEKKASNVVLVDPSDMEYPIGFNPLEAHSEIEKMTLSSDLVAMFKQHATSWGDQMTGVLANAINAFLESSTGGTLLELKRFLIEKEFRDEFLKNVHDSSVKYYWEKEFPLLKQYSLMPLLTRLDTFLRPKVLRHMMAQKKGLNFSEIINSGKTLLIKLPQGLIGEENSYLLGTLFVAKLYQAALGRQNLKPEERNPYFLYMDEFQHFMTPSMKGILSGTRKYGLGLVLAHQDLSQLFYHQAELANAVVSNPATRVCFRIGDIDARKLEDGFSYFDSSDLQSLGVGEAIVRLGAKDKDCNLSTSLVANVPRVAAEEQTRRVIEQSRSTYATKREDIQDDFKHQEQQTTSEQEGTTLEQSNQSKAEPSGVQVGEVFRKESTEEGAASFVREHTKKKEQSLHRSLQNQVQQLAQSYGYKAIVEEELKGGGRVDVGLLKDGIKIAVEISVTNTSKYESSNVMKCLGSGFDLVFVLSLNTDHLKKISEQVLHEVKNDRELERVTYVSYNELIEFFKRTESLEKQKESRLKGYRIKVNYLSRSFNADKSLASIILKNIGK